MCFICNNCTHVKFSYVQYIYKCTQCSYTIKCMHENTQKIHRFALKLNALRLIPMHILLSHTYVLYTSTHIYTNTIYSSFPAITQCVSKVSSVRCSGAKHTFVLIMENGRQVFHTCSPLMDAVTAWVIVKPLRLTFIHAGVGTALRQETHNKYEMNCSNYAPLMCQNVRRCIFLSYMNHSFNLSVMF